MKKLTIEEMQKLAKDRGGKCISRVYINYYTKLEWECSCGHRWCAAPGKIKLGQWCPYCTKYFTENKCRFIFEQLTNKKFPKNKRILNNRQEIDGYCEKLKIGFEYQGEQHYKIDNRFSEERFRQIQKQDIKKRNRINYLRQLGKIKEIIFIKYTQSTLDEKLEKYIIKRLNKIDSSLIKNTKIDYTDFYKNLSPLNELRELIKKKGGKLLSKTYINNHTKVKIQCKNNHIFKAMPSSLKSDRWCPYCAGKAKGTIKALKELVEKKGGKLLSKTYINRYTKVRVDCGKDHIFKMASNHLKRGYWCPYCSGNAKYVLKDMQKFARQNNGICYSSIYINAHAKMQWKCCKCETKYEKSYHEMEQRKYFCQVCRKTRIECAKNNQLILN